MDQCHITMSDPPILDLGTQVPNRFQKDIFKKRLNQWAGINVIFPVWRTFEQAGRLRQIIEKFPVLQAGNQVHRGVTGEILEQLRPGNLHTHQCKQNLALPVSGFTSAIIAMNTLQQIRVVNHPFDTARIAPHRELGDITKTLPGTSMKFLMASRNSNARAGRIRSRSSMKITTRRSLPLSDHRETIFLNSLLNLSICPEISINDFLSCLLPSLKSANPLV